MARQTRTGRRTVRLDGVALVEQAFVVELLQKPPQRLDKLVVVRDIGMVQVYEITHFLGQLAPFLCKLHHILAALAVVVLRGNIFARRLVVNILLGNAQLFLYAKFYGQSVGVPSGLAVNLKALHGLVTVKGVLDGTSQNMVNARVAISRGRTLEEYELGCSVSLVNTSVEDVITLPLSQYFLVGFHKV